MLTFSVENISLKKNSRLMGLQIIFIYTFILLKFSDELTFQSYLLGKFKNNWINTKVEELVYQRDSSMEQWTRTDNPEIGPYKHAQLIYDKGAKAIQ